MGRFFGGKFLHIVRNDQAGDAALGESNTHGAVDQMAHLRWHGAGLYVIARDVLEERKQVNLLLEVAA